MCWWMWGERKKRERQAHSIFAKCCLLYIRDILSVCHNSIYSLILSSRAACEQSIVHKNKTYGCNMNGGANGGGDANR